MRLDWIAARPGKILLLGTSVLLLQQVALPYNLTIAGEDFANASLAHLRVGLMLAIAMLVRDRLVLAACVFAEWCGWLIAAGTRDYGTVTYAISVLSAFFSYGWLVFCARWLGWPREPDQQRVSTTDVVRFTAIGLLIFPLGYVAINLTMFTVERLGDSSVGLARALGDVLPGMVQVYFAKYFGVAIVTLPLVVGWTERREPMPAGTAHVWLWLPALALVLLVSVVLTGLVRAGMTGAAGSSLMDYRLILIAVVGLCMLNLRPSMAMLLFSCMLFLLVRRLVEAANLSGTLVGSLNLAHLALEVGVVLIGMLYYTLAARDRRGLVARVHEQAQRDSVTGLPNYNALRGQPEARPGGRGEVGYLLLDQADALAVGFGLQTQAAVMNAVAARLASMTRAYYLGTGQFALLPDDEHACEQGWGSILASVGQMEHKVADRRVSMTPYLGVVAFGDNGRGDLEHALLSASNLAYEARRRSEVRPLHADEAHAVLPDEEQRRLHDAADAIASLRAGRFVLHFQEIFAIDDPHPGGMIRGEVLCRLLDEDGTLIQPGRFVDIIEAARGGPELDLAVMTALFRELRMYPAALGRFESIAVNLTGQSLSSDGFRTRLEELLSRAPVPLSKLCFEVTETAAISHADSARRLLQSLRDKGCHVAIDDFGTGMQNFARLRDLPFDIIKIDGSFVRNMLNDRRDFEFVQASVAVAKAFGADSVAEFVENEAVVECLREIGVRWAQGFLYARPRPLRSVLAGAALR